MRDFVYGDDVIIEAYKDNDYYPFACAEKVLIKMVSELLNTSVPDTGAWEHYEPSGRNGWSASLSGVTVLEDADDTLWFPLETLLIQLRTTGLDLRFRFKDKKGTEKYATGFALIPESEIGGDSGDFSRYGLQLQGSGPLDVNGIIIAPENPNVERIQWITTGAEPNKVQSNKLIGITKEQILVVSLESDDKFFVVDAGDPTDKQVRLDNAEGSLRWLYDFDPNQQIYCVILN